MNGSRQIFKNIVLEILLLAVMCFFGTVVMKIFDMLFNLGYENIWIVGFKVGFIAWLGLLVLRIVKKIKKDKNNKLLFKSKERY